MCEYMHEEDKALVIALVRAHVISDPEYMSWVPAHKRITGQSIGVVGGHWRRMAMCKRTIDCLACVCKQPDLAAPLPEHPLTGNKRRR